MQLGTFTANILVDGKALEEYDVVAESATKVTCWVASEEGKSFSVQWKCHEESRVAGTEGMVHVDGKTCGGILNCPGTLGVLDTCTLSCFIDATSTWDLKFARVQLSDDDSLLNKEIHKNLGEISLVITRGEVVKQLRSACEKNSFVPGDNQKLHERSKKATVHCVGFGPEKPRELLSYRRRLIRNSQPEITFVFKYQPLSVLQANGVAPRRTTNACAGHENSSNERDASVGTLDGRTSQDVKPAELNNRIRGLENELKRLRELQGGSLEEQKPKRIKTEDPGERSIRSGYH
ncbi:hypothetical protein OG21DRAFT_1508885 [Imleria badia]|nr:hypothetical protein OG21DRAFT_1508885 [Imleria badia]